MKKLINTVATTVDDMLEGCVAVSTSLAILEGHRVVVRSDFQSLRDSGAVALISGGGSGHEPAHAGYVGRGMLTAAVCGEIFTSPSTDAILTALRTVTGPAGALLIVKNYTGDRLNFGLAAEIARSEGMHVEMVVVEDDVALQGTEAVGRRGIAGTVLVHKVAGASAEAGRSLGEVRDAALKAIANIATMGVALRPCVVPGSNRTSFELGESEIEFGLGIHGESGRSREKLTTAAEVVDRLGSAVFDALRLARGDRIALMVNNLGATPPMELAIVAREALRACHRRGLETAQVWVGTFLTALDMAGCSITAMKLTPPLARALDAPCEAPAWPGQSHTDAGIRRISPPDAKGANRHVSRGPALPELRVALGEVARALQEAEPRLTELDRAAGDGDLGINLARGANAIEQALNQLTENHPADVLKDLSDLVRRTVGGTSGALYAAGLLRAATVLEPHDAPLPAHWAEALAEATTTISRLGDAGVGDRTMLDALVPAADSLGYRLTDGTRKALQAAIAAAEEGAASTATIVARRGRASYLGERIIGTRDPGAEAVCVWLGAIGRSLGA